MPDDLEKRITAKMVLDSSGFNNGIQGVNQQLKLAQSEFKASSERLGVFGTETDKLRANTEGLSKQIDLQRQKVDIYKSSIDKTTEKLQANVKTRDELKKSLDEANTKYSEAVKLYGKESEEATKAKESVDKLTEEYKKKEKQIESNAKQINNYSTNMNKADAELAKMQGELKKTNDELSKSENRWIQASTALKDSSEKIKSVGESASSAGDKILKLSAPLVGVSIASGKAAIDFESAFAGVRKTVDATEEQFTQLNQGIRDMTKIMPQSAVEISSVSEAAGQLGIKTNSILGFTKTMVMLGDSTNMSSEQAATALARLANITQMPQTEFQKLGSVIVALGNNLATTESEIVDMALRLAGAGKQVGMTEAQILSFAGALSSVGIEAEAGGSAFSKVMVNMQLAVETGNNDLANFAKVAGMTSKEFQKAFRDDASGALIAFIKGLETSKDKGESAIKVLDEMGISEVRMRDALLRASGAGDLFSDSIKLGTKAWEENSALTNEANQRYATTESQLKMTKNQIVDAAISIGNNLLPTIRDVSKSISNITEKFANMNPETQQAIIKATALAVGLGGVLKVGGGVVSTVGSLAGGLSKLTGVLGVAKLATQGVGIAASTAAGVGTAGGVSGLSTSLGAAAIAAGPWLLAGAAIVGVGYEINKSMSQEAIPAVNLFADKVEMSAQQVELANVSMGAVVESTTTKISDATKKAVGAYLDLDKKASQSLTSLFVNSMTITDQTATEMVGKYSEMTTKIKDQMDNHHKQLYAEMQTFFSNSKALTDEEEKEALAKLQKDNADKKAEIDNYTKRIQEILKNASNEKRSLTLSEQQEINGIQDKMKINAVKSLSDSEVESKIILERLKEYSTRISAEQASEAIKNAEKQRKESVDKANQQYTETVKNIIKMRDETGVITAEQADKLISDATRQKDESIIKAEEMKTGVVEQITTMNADIIKDIDTTDGHIMTAWDKLKVWFANNPIIRWIKTIGGGDTGSTPGSNWTGTESWRGGLTYMNERGYELYNLPQGTRIYNHDASEDLVLKTAESVANQVAQGLLNNMSRGNNGVNVTQHIYSPTSSPSEVARQTKNNLQQLALSW